MILISSLLKNLPTFMRGMRGVPLNKVPGQIFAGFTLAALMIPLNMGYAEMAGLPAIVGLYAAMLPLLVFSIFADSKSLIASPDAPVTALIPTVLLYALGVNSSLAILAFDCALIFFLLWYFRLGFLANFLSYPLLVGFISGLGIDIFLRQLRRIMSVPPNTHQLVSDSFLNIIFPVQEYWDKTAHNFINLLFDLVTQLPYANKYSVLIGIGTIVLVHLIKQFTPWLPGSLIAILMMTAAVDFFQLKEHGVEVMGIMEAGLPPIHLPVFNLHELVALLPSAMIICAVTLAEGLLLTKRFSQMYGDQADANQEIFAFGAANVAAGLTGALVMGSSASRTAAMDSAGARSQIPSLVASLVVAITLIFFSNLLALLPSAALAGVVASAVLGLIEVRKIKLLYQQRKPDFWLAMICLFSVLFIGIFNAVVVAFIFSLVLLVFQASKPLAGVLTKDQYGHFSLNADSDSRISENGVIIYQFNSALLFFNAATFADGIRKAVEQANTGGGQVMHFIVDASAIVDIDTTGASSFKDVLDFLEQQRIRLSISHSNVHFMDLLENYGLLDRIGKENFFVSNRLAIEALKKSTTN
jgi:high affinity sulfate transporter 1